MKREELEHVLRAASHIVKQRDFLVIGSAAILGTYSEDVLPRAASRSEEADLAPFNDPSGEKSAAVEGSLGQLAHDASSGRTIVIRAALAKVRSQAVGERRADLQASVSFWGWTRGRRARLMPSARCSSAGCRPSRGPG